jgi:Uma2 family endonuclease
MTTDGLPPVEIVATPIQTPRPAATSECKMTCEEFCLLPEQPGLQLIDGVVVREPSPSYSHQACVGTLYLLLCNHAFPGGLGQVVLAPFDVFLADDTVLQPDLLYVSQARAHLIKESGLFGAPDLAVEVLSPSTQEIDRGRKRDLYLQHGCQELWLVDLEAQTVTWHVNDGMKWRVKMLGNEATLISQVLPDLQIPLADFFGTL